MCTIYTPTPKCRNLLSSILYADIGTHSDPHVTGLNKSFTEEECQASRSAGKASLPLAVSSLLVVPKAPECRHGVSKQGTKPRITAQGHSEDETDTGEPGESLIS